ncbi:hypothetical protein PF005_g31396 [Phytophthora fragariae]|uniref:Uncharacterized protein n=1 Tax=Phytophthora fragariae TaxID=53985 RepID=A0A6A3V7L9_9STRA|nr:hypothetical protein PF010_g30618 [Phytophthora fragariae]KAE9066865.1 hypothetical protein PF007_g28282 [Phytophthora fragariae]KAE9070360.1 hypothetical protein PF006_g29376 [Phytophthora fragariae]KAE9161039.1 hypothetical protein PF005_g31396 [Phytophthora fragariae]KAE9168216.1 hypothetical protein PF004_g28576 [Phytophthora fragariae]
MALQVARRTTLHAAARICQLGSALASLHAPRCTPPWAPATARASGRAVEAVVCLAASPLPPCRR